MTKENETQEDDKNDQMPEDKFFRKAILLRVVDGDTLDVKIDLGWSIKLKERLRLEHVDTPEINKKLEKEAGKWVKTKVEEWLPLGTELMITSKAYERTGKVRGKYGRTLARVYHLEEKWCLNAKLINEEIAWATDDKGDLLSERSLTLLTGLPQELR